MDSKQLIDLLTAHISLYHSSSTSYSLSTNSNPRSSILKWFSSLTVHQRQAHLTVVDPKFVQILLQMQDKLRSNGHGCFIVLPDVPSDDDPGVPSLCYRRSHGLLARVSESEQSERLIYDSIRLFNSKGGIKECSCSANCLDSMIVSEQFVESVDRFVATMDGVSSGAFLRGEEGGLSSEWVESDWLKAKGYYSIAAFVANRLEVALKLSWLHCNNGKKRGVKLKEKASAAGVAANVYWRKKGCMDWWGKLDSATRRNVFRVVLGKTAKSLTDEILKMTNGSLENQTRFFDSGADRSMRFANTLLSQRNIPILPGLPASVSRKPSSLAYMFYGLLVLQEIFTLLLACEHSELDQERVLFSSLPFVGTISDCIFRKLRGLLMVVSLDCTKLELLEEGTSNFPTKKSEEKIGAASRRKKGKTRNMKRLNRIPGSSGEDVQLDKAVKKEDLDGEIPPPAVVMESGEVFVHGNVKSAARKSRKESNGVKKSGLSDSVEVVDSQTRVMKVSSPSVISQGEVAKSDWVSENPIIQNMPNYVSTGNDKNMPNLSPHTGGPTREDKLVQSNEEDNVFGSFEGQCKYSDSGQENHSTSFASAALNAIADSNIIPPLMPVVGLDDVCCNDDIDCGNCGNLSETDNKSVFSGVKVKGVESPKEITPVQEQKGGTVYDTQPINSSGCPSYEWPSVAPVHFPSVNSHIPATTDRLHLDVGYNWQNHFHQSFVPTVHQVRNPPSENGCSHILSRPLRMSLDWPPMVRSSCGLASSATYSYDSGFISRRRSSFHPGFTAQSIHSATTSDDERIYSGDFMDLADMTSTHELTDEHDNHGISEEEFEVHAVSGMDYSQYFGGGVMYWNPSDHPGTSFSRPPSLSSDDSLWAWREADMTRAVDDMVAFSSSYSTNGLTSPSTASFCSPFDPLAPGHQAVGYVIPANEVTSKLLHSSSTISEVGAEDNVSGSLSSLSGDGEVKTGDSLPYPILRPIIIPNIARERSRSEFKRSHDLKSPCVPLNRREGPRIKRPPSPVVLCVPHAPRPPPPSPVGDSRKHRGYPTVRSGSSSPKHWGMRGLFQDGISFEEACVRMDGSEVVWSAWRNKSLSAHSMMQPLPGPLLQDHLIAISQLTRDQEHPDVAFPLQPPESLNCPTRTASLSLMHSLLHDEIDAFCKQVAAENLTRKPHINWAVKRVARSLQVLWPRSRTSIFGSYATGLSLPTSDVDLVVCLPPVRNLEPIKEAGILEGRNGIKETCLQHAARYLANQEWVKNDSLKIVENTAIPIIMLVVEVPHDLVTPAASTVSALKKETGKVIGEGVQTNMVNQPSVSPKCSNMNHDDDKDMRSIRIDISFKSPSHTGLQTTELVKELTEQFPAATPLALVLKQFMADRSLDQSYSGGLSSYCLVLLITRFLQHEHHHGRPINQNFGSLLMDFLYFFGNVFDPRQMCISVQGSGVYINRERGYSIDPIYIDDPLFPTNNVGRNCFRIHQCIKAFADAYSTLENELACLPSNGESSARPAHNLLPKIIPSICTL